MISADTFQSIIRIFSALAIVMGLIFLFLFILKRILGNFKGSSKLIRTITIFPVAPKKYISLLDVAGEIIVIGITSQQISMLCKVEDKDSISMIRSQMIPQNTLNSFRRHLEGIISNFSRSTIRENQVSIQGEK
jgi:flagellar protein FliO/FliZ